MTKTTVITYKSEGAMQRDIKNRERKGYAVMSVTRNGQGYSFAKTAVLGLVFLPLALLGKKGDVFQVTYQHEEKMGFWDAVKASQPKKAGFWEQVAAEAERKRNAKSAP
jgi:hypothetical protein